MYSLLPYQSHRNAIAWCTPISIEVLTKRKIIKCCFSLFDKKKAFYLPIYPPPVSFFYIFETCDPGCGHLLISFLWLLVFCAWRTFTSHRSHWQIFNRIKNQSEYLNHNP